MSDLIYKTLAEAQAALASGETTPTQLTTACLERIETTDKTIHACITVAAESALAQAKALEMQGYDATKSLWGIPITVKDNICVQGMKTTCASKFLDNFIPPYDAFVIKKLKDAGAIIIAKTNLDEFAMGSSTEHSAFGVTLNPHNPAHVAGGSSGGSAASVAAYQCFGSLGSDSGGSIRQPAAFCGCVGFKPTYGMVSRYGAVAYASSFDQIGSLARTVEDCAIVYNAIAGYDPLDPTSANEPVPSIAPVTAKKNLEGVTLGVVKEFWEGGIDPSVLAECQHALNKAKDLGANTVDISLPHLAEHGIATYYILTCAEASTNMARFDGVRFGQRCENPKDLQDLYIRSRSLGLGEEVKRRILLGTYVLSAGYYDAYFQKAAKIRRLILQDFQQAFTQCDALIAPSTPVQAWKVGNYANDPLSAYKMDILTVGLNLAGLPGLSLPTRKVHENSLPVGIQLMGNAFEDVNLLSIAHALEQGLN